MILPWGMGFSRKLKIINDNKLTHLKEIRDRRGKSTYGVVVLAR